MSSTHDPDHEHDDSGECNCGPPHHTTAGEVPAVAQAYRAARDIAREINTALQAIGVPPGHTRVLPAVSDDGQPMFVVFTEPEHAERYRPATTGGGGPPPDQTGPRPGRAA